MGWLNSTNAKEIGTLYLIFAVFAGMIGTAFSVLIRLELSSPGVQFLQGDHQLFNGAPLNCFVRSDEKLVVVVKLLNLILTSQGQPNPIVSSSKELLSLKATTLASLGQLNGENSTVVKLSERTSASYGSHGEDNKSLQLSTLVLIPDMLVYKLYLLTSWLHFLGEVFYVEVLILIWSSGRVARSNLKERRHLKEPIGGQNKNSGSPEGKSSGGDGGLILARVAKFKPNLVKGSRCISTKDSIPAGFDKLGKLRELNSQNTSTINTKILNLMCDTNILIGAYTKLKSTPGNMNPGVHKEILDEKNLAWFENLKKELHTNQFQFIPARRLEVLKLNGKVNRPLGIVSSREKIVQGAIILVLEAIFEPSFLQHSHGYHPNRACHSALEEVKQTFTAVNWFIEGDISKCFDSFDHNLLISLVSKRIKDKGFMDLLHKALRAGYLLQGQKFSHELGFPQGSIVSPILCNILFHGLDEYVLSLKENFNIGTRSKSNPERKNITRVGNVLEVHNKNIGSCLQKETSYKRLVYVRYADKFLIGIIGSLADCNIIRDKIFLFLQNELKLNLNLENSKITHAKFDSAHFLGTDIRMRPLHKKPSRLVIRVNSRYQSKFGKRPQLLAPINKIVNKLVEKGFAKPGGKPTRFTRMIPFETHQIVNHFNLMWRGFSNYYSFAENYGKMGRIYYILKYSCVLTLASKLRLFTAKKVFAKFGKNTNIIVNNNIVASFPVPSFDKPKKNLNLNFNKYGSCSQKR